jgi:hypothetical protein
MTAHVVPVTSSDDRPHDLGAGACWCQPAVDDYPVQGRVVIHRRFMDGPARDPDDDGGWFVTTVGDRPLSPPRRQYGSERG